MAGKRRLKEGLLDRIGTRTFEEEFADKIPIWSEERRKQERARWEWRARAKGEAEEREEENKARKDAERAAREKMENLRLEREAREKEEIRERRKAARGNEKAVDRAKMLSVTLPSDINYGDARDVDFPWDSDGDRALYQVTTEGKVRVLGGVYAGKLLPDAPRVMSEFLRPMVILSCKLITYSRYRDDLVAAAFYDVLGECPEGYVLGYHNNDPSDPRLVNLYWRVPMNDEEIELITSVRRNKRAIIRQTTRLSRVRERQSRGIIMPGEVTSLMESISNLKEERRLLLYELRADHII